MYDYKAGFTLKGNIQKYKLRMLMVMLILVIIREMFQNTNISNYDIPLPSFSNLNMLRLFIEFLKKLNKPIIAAFS